MGDSTSIHGTWGAWFDSAPLPVLVHQDRRVLYANGAAARLLGSAATDLVGEPVPSGEATAMWNCPEGTVLLFGDGRDRDDRFRRLFEEAPIAYHEIDSHGTIVRVNRAECELLGFAPEELLGKAAWEIVSPEQRKISRARVAAKLTGKEKLVAFERPYTRRDGVTLLLEVHERLIVDDSGRTTGIRTALLNITEKKSAEEQLQRKNEELDLALKAAREAAELKSQFLANMSHEIRTPMNGVIGMTGLLLDTALTPEQREYAETVRNSAESLLGVINDILDFSKIEAGKLIIESVPFELNLVIEEVNEMLAHKAEDHNLVLILEYPAGIPRRFLGDAGRIRQVLTNLVGNAVKFTHAGHIIIAVSCQISGKEEASMKISVRDTGIGIAADKIGSLFEKFTQVDGAPTRRYGGTGLGLAISKQLVELMGGTIGVESRPGEGSTFWFTVPLQLDGSPAVEPAPAGALRNLRALIVDDNELNRRMLHEQVSTWGLRDSLFADADRVIPAMHEARRTGDPFQFVLLDYMMPGMDGVSLAQAIKSDAELRDTALIMLTSVGHWSEVRQLEGAGVDASLVKPVRQWQLLNALSTTWSRHNGPAPAAVPERVRQESLFAGMGIRVLLAEDNVVNQKVGVRMLERLGVRADVAANGLEAVDMFQLAWYDLIFLDCQMPEMDGYAAAGEIRRLEQGERRVAIVAMTADVMGDARERCLAAGMDDYIAKPVKFEQLTDILREWVVDTK
jgi:two-component system, sensor histidine kinase and response regulator